MFRKTNVIKTVPFLVLLKYREIITVKIVTFIRNFIFFVKSLKSKTKKLALILFRYVSQEIRLGNSKKLICLDQSRFYIFSHPQELKNI